MRGGWRRVAWKCGAGVAVLATVFAWQSENQTQQLTNAFSSLSAEALATADLPTAVAVIPKNFAGEIAAPPMTVHVATTGDDPLAARITGSQRPDDVTGTITPAAVSVQEKFWTVSDAPAREEMSAPRIRFGVDLGVAASVEAMRAQWAVILANHAALIDRLRPLSGVRQSKPGMSELRLIAGPFDDIAVAVKLCAALTALHTYCRTAVFDGQPLGVVEHSAVGDPMPVMADVCPGNSNALGTSRVLEVSANEYARVGLMQYEQTLPLGDREVVLTFDDGPIPTYTDHVLATLATECVKATFFMVGRHANAHPDAVRRVHSAGHTIGTHSQNHSYAFASMSAESAVREINDGIASVAAALGDSTAIAPFFRFPGFLRAKPVENYLSSRAIMTWSADIAADDWHKNIGANEVLARALSRLEAKGRGILLLHDIQPATVLMLPKLLKELKNRGYRIVQVVPAEAESAKALPVASLN